MLSLCPSPLRCRHQDRIKLVKISSCDKIDRKWRGDWKSWESYQITSQGCRQRGEREGRLNGTRSRLWCNQHKEARLWGGGGDSYFSPSWAYFDTPAVLICFLKTSHGKYGFHLNRAMNCRGSSWTLGQQYFWYLKVVRGILMAATGFVHVFIATLQH